MIPRFIRLYARGANKSNLALQSCAYGQQLMRFFREREREREREKKKKKKELSWMVFKGQKTLQFYYKLIFQTKRIQM
jgi:hypothetical protein